MIISASYRTDIPAFYNAWFSARLAAGEVWVKNPYGSKPYRVSLERKNVDGFVFWTRNWAPFAEAAAAVDAIKCPYFVQYTVTGYPKALEVGVPPAAHSIAVIARLAAAKGRAAAVWRYDPILFSSITPPGWHLENFAGLAKALRPHVEEVTVSFANIYRKTARNLAVAAAEHGFEWQDPPQDERRAFLQALAEIAADADMRLTVCSQPELEQPGVAGVEVAGAACIDVERLSRIAGVDLKARIKGNRPGCLCAESRDLGSYDTCAHGCTYCYAVNNREKAMLAVKQHDWRADMLA
jgi:hypothetical protein